MSSDRELVERYGAEVVRAALAPFLTDERQATIDRVLDQRLTTVTVVLENLYDSHNGAAALRSLEALGLAEVHLVEEASPFKSAPGVSIGSERWLEVHRYPDVTDCAAALKQRGFTLAGTCPAGDRTIGELDPERPVALLFGNEHEGLSERALELCDCRVRIPMFGFTQSFNLSVSVALGVERAAARRRRALAASGDLEEQKKRQLRAQWYAASVRGAAGIIERFVASQTR